MARPILLFTGQWSEVPVSNFRGELSAALSDDDGKTWSKPVVVARGDRKQWIAYPYAFEAKPGEVWVTTMQGGARFVLRGRDRALFWSPPAKRSAGSGRARFRGSSRLFHEVGSARGV